MILTCKLLMAGLAKAATFPVPVRATEPVDSFHKLQVCALAKTWCYDNKCRERRSTSAAKVEESLQEAFSHPICRVVGAAVAKHFQMWALPAQPDDVVKMVERNDSCGL